MGNDKWTGYFYLLQSVNTKGSDNVIIRHTFYAHQNGLPVNLYLFIHIYSKCMYCLRTIRIY